MFYYAKRVKISILNVKDLFKHLGTVAVDSSTPKRALLAGFPGRSVYILPL